MLLAHEGETDAALRLLADFLASESAAPESAQALALRAHILSGVGRQTEALEAAVAARSLLTPVSYERHTIELLAGVAAEGLGDAKSARRWYVAALATAVESNVFTGAVPLVRLLRLVPQGDLTRDEREVCQRFVVYSWRLLDLEGQPDPNDLASAGDVIVKAGSYGG